MGLGKCLDDLGLRVRGLGSRSVFSAVGLGFRV